MKEQSPIEYSKSSVAQGELFMGLDPSNPKDVEYAAVKGVNLDAELRRTQRTPEEVAQEADLERRKDEEYARAKGF